MEIEQLELKVEDVEKELATLKKALTKASFPKTAKS